MYRTLPIFLIFFSIGVFFLVVNNLTDKKIEKVDKEKVVDPEILKLTEKVVVIQKEKTLEKSIIGEPKEMIISQKTEIKKKSKESETKVSEKKELKKNNVLLQFGAFSNKESAEILQRKIERKIKNKYEKFSLFIKKGNSKNIYKLLHKSNNLMEAKEICNYSKSVMFDCYIKK